MGRGCLTSSVLCARPPSAPSESALQWLLGQFLKFTCSNRLIGPRWVGGASTSQRCRSERRAAGPQPAETSAHRGSSSLKCVRESESGALPYLRKDIVRLAEDPTGVCVRRHEQLQCSDINVRAQSPEVRLLQVVDSLQLLHLRRSKQNKSGD